MRRQQHVVGIAGQREHERKCPWQQIRILPSCPARAATTTALRAQPPPLSTNQRRESWGPAVIGGEAWGRVTSGHGGCDYTVEHVVVCSDWRETLSPTCWTSQVLGLDKCRTGLAWLPGCYSRANSTIQNYSLNYSVMSSSLIFVITHILKPKLWRENLTFMLLSELYIQLSGAVQGIRFKSYSQWEI